MENESLHLHQKMKTHNPAKVSFENHSKWYLYPSIPSAMYFNTLGQQVVSLGDKNT